jgi:hypothetical protein
MTYGERMPRTPLVFQNENKLFSARNDIQCKGTFMGNVGDYIGAVREMTRYLTLVPNAPDARAAQDKAYLWEGKLR